MREDVKKKIRKELKVILADLSNKNVELTKLKIDEEGMPNTQKEATDEFLSGARDHSATMKTSERLEKLRIMEVSFNLKEAEFQKLMVESSSNELEILNEVELYCKYLKKEINKI